MTTLQFLVCVSIGLVLGIIAIIVRDIIKEVRFKNWLKRYNEHIRLENIAAEKDGRADTLRKQILSDPEWKIPEEIVKKMNYAGMRSFYYRDWYDFMRFK